MSYKVYQIFRYTALQDPMRFVSNDRSESGCWNTKLWVLLTTSPKVQLHFTILASTGKPFSAPNISYVSERLIFSLHSGSKLWLAYCTFFIVLQRLFQLSTCLFQVLYRISLKAPRPISIRIVTRGKHSTEPAFLVVMSPFSHSCTGVKSLFKVHFQYFWII